MLAPDGKDSADAFGEETGDCIADVWSSAPEEASGAGGAGERLTDCMALRAEEASGSMFGGAAGASCV